MLSSIAAPRFDYTRLSPYPLTASTYKGNIDGIRTTEEQLR